MSGVCENTQNQKHSLLGQQCISVAQAPTGKEAGFTGMVRALKGNLVICCVVESIWS